MKKQRLNKNNIPEKGTQVFIKSNDFGVFKFVDIIPKTKDHGQLVKVEHYAFSFNDVVFRVRHFKISEVSI